LEDLNSYNKMPEKEKTQFLIRKMLILRRSLTYLFALLCFMSNTNKRGFIKTYIKELENILEKENIGMHREEVLCLLTPVRELSFYNKLLVEIYELSKRLTTDCWGNPNAQKARDRVLISSFAQKYCNGATEYVLKRLRMFHQLSVEDIGNLEKGFLERRRRYKSILKKIKMYSEQNKKRKLYPRVIDILGKIQTILYFEHTYEPRQRMRLALGDLLIRYIAVSILFNRKVIESKHPYLTPQDLIIEKLYEYYKEINC